MYHIYIYMIHIIYIYMWHTYIYICDTCDIYMLYIYIYVCDLYLYIYVIHIIYMWHIYICVIYICDIYYIYMIYIYDIYIYTLYNDDFMKHICLCLRTSRTSWVCFEQQASAPEEAPEQPKVAEARGGSLRKIIMWRCEVILSMNIHEYNLISMAIPLYIYILCILHHIAVSMESDADDAVEYQVPETHFSYILIVQVRLMHVPMLAPSLGPAGKWERQGTMWLYIGHYRVDRRAWPLNCEWMWMAICKLEGSFLVPAETGWWFLVEAGHAWTLKWCWNVV